MTWKPELDELRRREELAREMGGPERVARQRAAGKLTVRERVERLLDPGSFHETGALAGRGEYGLDPRDTRPILCDWAVRAHELIAIDTHHGPVARGTRP